MVDFGTNIFQHVKINEDGIGIITSQNLIKPRRNSQNSGSYLDMKNQGNIPIPPLQNIIDTMGKLSADAQALKQIITTFDKLAVAHDNVIFLKASMENKRVVQGFIKIGYKNLFYRDEFGKIQELKPLCVLDFYVHESCQRTGLGKQLFEFMLKFSDIQPEKIAYDRPSPKLLGFLKKHYGLAKYIPQNNNYVIFSQYFENENTVLLQKPVNQEQSNLPGYREKPPLQKLKNPQNFQKNQTSKDNTFQSYETSMKQIKIEEHKDNLSLSNKKNQSSNFMQFSQTEDETRLNKFKNYGDFSHQNQQYGQTYNRRSNPQGSHTQKSNSQNQKEYSTPWAIFGQETLNSNQYQTSSNQYGNGGKK